MKTVLIVEDDIDLAATLCGCLRVEGFEVECLHDGEAGIAAILSGEHAITILDLDLPKLNGVEVLRRARAVTSAPIIVHTGRGELVDKILGLELGADDYVQKPIHPRELGARIRAVLRRFDDDAQTESSRAPLQVGAMMLDPAARAASWHSKKVGLTALEFNVLEVLLRSAGQVVTREVLVSRALGRNLSPMDRSVDVLVSKIRRKLMMHNQAEDPIKAVRSVGYQFAFTHKSLPSVLTS